MPPALPKTRLDPLVRWKARALEQTKRLLAEKLTRLAAARARVAQASALLDRAPPERADAAAWDLQDRVSAAGRSALVSLEQEVAVAEAEIQVAQAACVEANRETEVFRRASERERSRLLQEIERRERHTMDELAILLRDRR